MKAIKWNYKTILSIIFKCEKCETIHNIDYTITNDNIKIFSIQCVKCQHINKIEQ